MNRIDLREDALRFRDELERVVSSLAESKVVLSALEFGYDCDQGGWILIHGDRREKHHRDGEWTRYIDDESMLPMSHWTQALDSNFEGEEIELISVDGTTRVLPAFDPSPGSSNDDDALAIAVAVGEMIYAVVMQAKSEGLFVALSGPLNGIQLDFEDFNGGWAWPDLDGLGIANLA